MNSDHHRQQSSKFSTGGISTQDKSPFNQGATNALAPSLSTPTVAGAKAEAEAQKGGEGLESEKVVPAPAPAPAFDRKAAMRARMAERMAENKRKVREGRESQ